MSYKNYIEKCRKGFCAFLVCCLMTALLSACSGNVTKNKSQSSSTDVLDLNAYDDTLDIETMFSDRDLNTSYEEADAVRISLADSKSTATKNSSDDSSQDVNISGNVITVSSEGTYLISGSLSEGQIVVDADGQKVHLVLDGVTISNSSSAAIYVKNAKKVFLTLAEGSTNSLSTTGEYVAIDDNHIDAVIFSKEDLTLNGSGSLTVESSNAHGIVSKDDLVITSGTYEITAASHAIAGKDSVRISDGAFVLKAGKDAIHSSGSSNTTSGDPVDGYVYLAGGTFDISCDDDGVHANGALHIDNGTINITKCNEGLEGLTITVNAGDINVVASDDGLNAGNGTSGDQGQMGPGGNHGTRPDGAPDGNMTPPDGSQNGNMTPPDGSQNGNMTPPDSAQNDNMTPPDSAQNDNMTPPDGSKNGNSDENREHDFSGKSNDSNHPDGMHGGGDMGYCSDDWILINGGTIQITANGDGIDSNGNLLITGGTITVSGRSSGPDSAIDFSGEAAITGGYVIATGSSEMAEKFSEKSTQGCIMRKLDSTVSGSVSFADSKKNILGTFTPSNEYNCIFISSSNLTKGETYTLSYGTTSEEITMDSLVLNK